jgi:hypothetical protein
MQTELRFRFDRSRETRPFIHRVTIEARSPGPGFETDRDDQAREIRRSLIVGNRYIHECDQI